MRVLLRFSPHQPEAKKDYRASGERGWRHPACMTRAWLPHSIRESLPETGNHCRPDRGIPIYQTAGANTAHAGYRFLVDSSRANDSSRF